MGQMIESLKTGDGRVASSKLILAESLCCILEQNTLLSAA